MDPADFLFTAGVLGFVPLDKLQTTTNQLHKPLLNRYSEWIVIMAAAFVVKQTTIVPALDKFEVVVQFDKLLCFLDVIDVIEEFSGVGPSFFRPWFLFQAAD